MEKQPQFQESQNDKNKLLSKLKSLKRKPRLVFEIIGVILILSLATASSDMVPQEDYDLLQKEYNSLQEDYDSLQAKYDDTVSDLKLANTSLKDTVSEYDEYKAKMQPFEKLSDEELEIVSSRIDQTLADKAAEEEAQKKAEEEAAAQAAAQAQTQAQAAVQANQQTQGQMVWIPQTGSKYHSNSSCSNMKNPSQVSLSQAQAAGYAPCKKCY